MCMTHLEPKYVLSNGIAISTNRKQTRFSRYIDLPAHAHACTSTNALCKEGLCTYGVPIGIHVCERVHLWAHTRCARTHTLARTLARAHVRASTRTHTDAAHTDAAHVCDQACVCAHAHTRCTRTHTLAHTCTHIDTAHTRCAAPVACVCARARA